MDTKIQAILKIARDFFNTTEPIGEQQPKEVDQHAGTGLGVGGASFSAPIATE